MEAEIWLSQGWGGTASKDFLSRASLRQDVLVLGSFQEVAQSSLSEARKRVSFY